MLSGEERRQPPRQPKRLIGTGYCGDALRSPGKTCEQYRHDAGQEDAVEGAGTANGGDGGYLEVALLAEIMAGQAPTQICLHLRGAWGKGGKGGVFVKGERYPITVEALKTRWQCDRAKAALVLPSVANIRWHDLRGTFGSSLL
jgi:hypothetical protein